MLLLATDADFDGPLYRTLIHREPGLDISRVQEAGLRTADDPRVLEWAALEGRVLLSHDRKTMSYHAYDRVKAGLMMPGVVVVHRPKKRQRARIVEQLLMIAICSTPEECRNRVQFVPF